MNEGWRVENAPTAYKGIARDGVVKYRPTCICVSVEFLGHVRACCPYELEDGRLFVVTPDGPFVIDDPEGWRAFVSIAGESRPAGACNVARVYVG